MKAKERFVIAGAGGHAKVVVATIEAAGHEVVSVLDDDPVKHGSTVLGHAVVGAITASRVPEGAVVVLGVGSNKVRKALAARLTATFGTVVHPSAVVHPSVKVGPGAVILAGAVVQPDSVIGPHAIINTSASVDHDCVLGPFVHLAPGAHLAGGVTLGEGVLMGIGSCAVPGVSIGAWATVGAGGVVVNDIGDGVVATGVPARERRGDRT